MRWRFESRHAEESAGTLPPSTPCWATREVPKIMPDAKHPSGRLLLSLMSGLMPDHLAIHRRLTPLFTRAVFWDTNGY